MLLLQRERVVHGAVRIGGGNQKKLDGMLRVGGQAAQKCRQGALPAARLAEDNTVEQRGHGGVRRTLDELVHQRDYIVWPNHPWFQYLSVESAEPPARAGRIAGLDLWIVNGQLNPSTVDVQGRARAPQFGDFEHRLAGTVSLADTHRAAVESDSRQIFAERTRIERESLGDQFINSFGSDDENRLARAAVDQRMRPAIATDSLHGDMCFGNRAFGNSAGRDIDLQNGGGHDWYIRSERTT